MVDFTKIRSVYFIGIGGIGISAIARMMLGEGKKVFGSDLVQSEITDELVKLGAKISIGQDISLVPKNIDLIIYTVAVSEFNPELMKQIRVLGVPVISYPETLHEISKDKYTIAISGTHGKTTTTAMIAKVLMDAKLDPTVIVGSLLQDAEQMRNGRGTTQRTNFIAGKSKYFVVEACEYRRSFLQLQPTILVITNIDNDHLDYYKNLAEISKAFGELVAKIPKDGFVVCNPNSPLVKDALKGAKCAIVDYTKFRKNLKLKIPGEHNQLDAAVALAVASILKLEEQKMAKSLEDFAGTWRRFEYCGKTKNGAMVYDDYGHHPTEIRATLKGARELYLMQKIVVVFQPHLYSRTRDHLLSFGTCFNQADEVILLPIYPAREVDPGNIDSGMVVSEIKKNSQSAHLVNIFAEAAKKSISLTGKGDIIITLGAGETNKVADILTNF